MFKPLCLVVRKPAIKGLMHENLKGFASIAYVV